MIRIIKTYDESRDFAFGFNDDLHFSDPMLCHEEQLQNNLVGSIEKPDWHNDPAIRLYASMGFAKVQGQNNLTAHWSIPGAER